MSNLRLDNVETRMVNIEKRLNELTNIISNLVSTRESTSIRVLLESQISDLKSEIQLIQNEISNLKNKLRIR